MEGTGEGVNLHVERLRRTDAIDIRSEFVAGMPQPMS